MPVYQYEPKPGEEGCEYCEGGFEDTASMKDDPLECCPRCAVPVRRVVTSVNLNSKYASKLDIDRARKLGFKTGTDLINDGTINMDT